MAAMRRFVHRLHRLCIHHSHEDQEVSKETSLSMIAARLKWTRQAKGLNQASWCRLAGIEPQAWNNYESGLRRISIDQALKVCRVSGVTLDWIYRGVASGMPVELATSLLELERWTNTNSTKEAI